MAYEDGNFDWAVPDEEVHAFINELDRHVGAYLYGCHMYETVAGWETDPALADLSPLIRTFAQIWQRGRSSASTPGEEGVAGRRTPTGEARSC